MPPLTSLSLLFMQDNNNRLSVSPFGALTISGWGWGEGQEHLGVSEDGARAWGHRRLAVAEACCTAYTAYGMQTLLAIKQ
jgi:hypothetical protein